MKYAKLPRQQRVTMSGTGYAAVGHLFELADDNQNQPGLKRVLEKIVTHVRYPGFIDETCLLLNRNTQEQYEKFFSNVVINMDSAHRYLSTIVKPTRFEDRAFGSKVERIVWNLLKSDPKWNQVLINPQKSSEKREEGICFQIFCLFNRFCECEHIPMKINDEALKFLLKKFGIQTSQNKLSFTFLHFLECVYQRRDSFILVGIKQAYDEYIRDVLIEKRISFRTRTYYSGKLTGRQKVKIGK